MNGLVGEASEESPTQTRLLARLAALLLSCLAIMLAFIELLKFDVPLTRYVRSLNDFQLDHLHNPWLEELSDLGDLLGRGESLALVSAGLLVVGYGVKRAAWIRAGWETLLAHALSGLINNGLKHVVGRARPKFMHAGNTEFAPLAGSGWDSFPSGHSMASFAVATVLAVQFPKVRWPIMSLALAIAVSRLLRGAHYLSDIAAGAILGVFIGALLAHPWKDWRASLASALFAMTGSLVSCLVLMTTIAYAPENNWTGRVLRDVGLVITLLALILVVLIRVQPLLLPSFMTRPLMLSFIGLGIGMFSGSSSVAIIMMLICLAHWIHNVFENDVSPQRPWPYEAAFGLAVLLTLYMMVELRGALPIG